MSERGAQPPTGVARVFTFSGGDVISEYFEFVEKSAYDAMVELAKDNDDQIGVVMKERDEWKKDFQDCYADYTNAVEKDIASFEKANHLLKKAWSADRVKLVAEIELWKREFCDSVPNDIYQGAFDSISKALKESE